MGNWTRIRAKSPQGESHAWDAHVGHPFSEGHLGPFDGLRDDIKTPLPSLPVNNTLFITEKTFVSSALLLSLSHDSTL